MGLTNKLETDDRPYEIGDLVEAVSELKHAQVSFQKHADDLKAKRAAILSLEKAEAEHFAELARREMHVKKVAANLKK